MQALQQRSKSGIRASIQTQNHKKCGGTLQPVISRLTLTRSSLENNSPSPPPNPQQTSILYHAGQSGSKSDVAIIIQFAVVKSKTNQQHHSVKFLSKSVCIASTSGPQTSLISIFLVLSRSSRSNKLVHRKVFSFAAKQNATACSAARLSSGFRRETS